MIKRELEIMVIWYKQSKASYKIFIHVHWNVIKFAWNGNKYVFQG